MRGAVVAAVAAAVVPEVGGGAAADVAGDEELLVEIFPVISTRWPACFFNSVSFPSSA